MESTAKERLRDLIKKLNCNISSFSNRIGVSQTSVSTVLTRGKTITSPILEGLINAFPEANIEWLITGKGEMLKPLQHGNGINSSFDGTYYGGKFAGRDIIDSSNNSGNAADSSYNNNTRSSESINDARLLAKIESLKSKIESMSAVIENKDIVIKEKERIIEEKERLIQVLLDRK